MSIQLTEESICNANALFWEQMLAMRLEPASGEAMAGRVARCIGPEHMVGGCDLSGVWMGRIEVRLSRGLALEATSAMLMQAAESVQPSDTVDAVKEIANMIAGTIKSGLPRPCSMTVPWAEVESREFCCLPQTPNSLSVFFRHAAGELMIRVWQEGGDAEA